MHKLDQRGELIVPLAISVVLLLASIGFGAWAFMGRQDYKNNVDIKIEEAVEAAEQNLTIKKDLEFLEKEKDPNDVYVGPSAFGTLTISYPKTWSNYLVEKAGTPIDGYMHPKYVSSNTNEVNYALRYQVLERQYDQELKSFESRVKTGKAKVSAFAFPSQPNIVGVRVEGEIDSRKIGVVTVVPLRDKTIKVWTEGEEFRDDFEKIISKLTFLP